MPKKKIYTTKKTTTDACSENAVKGRAMVKTSQDMGWTRTAIECDDGNGTIKWHRGCSNKSPDAMLKLFKSKGFEIISWDDQLFPDVLRY